MLPPAWEAGFVAPLKGTKYRVADCHALSRISRRGARIRLFSLIDNRILPRI
ncbi:MAG: hypothetical protein LC737_06755 [Chloroflexi bacterium]|nr:hypothetical protein [Chloroflexota bacterium]